MKLHFFIIAITTFLFFAGCEDDINNNDNNPCLIDKNVNVVYNGNLPTYADLIEFTGTSIFIQDEVNFIKGVYILNNGTDFFTAFELAEPNDCSQICNIPTKLTDAKFEYTCGDETRSYNLNGTRIDGDDDDFNMRIYTAKRSGNTLTISY